MSAVLKNEIITNNAFFKVKNLLISLKNILNQYFHIKKIMNPIKKIIKRLEIIINYILLDDIEELNKEISKIGEYDYDSELQEIINDLNNQEFALAIKKIQNFIGENQQLSIWADPEISVLKLEIKNLEKQLSGFVNEKIELEKLLSEFQHRHTIELGEIILHILKIRKVKFIENKTKYEEAENDERQYREQVDYEKENEIFELTEEQKLELKKKFRRATVLCHPDKFANETVEIQTSAEGIFKELNQANAKNDLQKVSEILSNLEKGILSTIKGDKLTDKDILRETINRLRSKVKVLELEITIIKQSETFKTIMNIDNWDDYFISTKKKLLHELEELTQEIKGI